MRTQIGAAPTRTRGHQPPPLCLPQGVPQVGSRLVAVSLLGAHPAWLHPRSRYSHISLGRPGWVDTVEKLRGCRENVRLIRAAALSHRQIKVAPFSAVRDRQNALGFVPTAQWSGWAIKKLPSALAAVAARSHSVKSSPDRRARTCCSRTSARIGSISGIAETSMGKKRRSTSPAAQNRL